MALHNETNFENEVCEYLAAHGWLYAEKDATDYDRELALFPADVLAWVQETQPDAWDALTKSRGSAAGSTLTTCGDPLTYRRQLVTRMAK